MSRDYSIAGPLGAGYVIEQADREFSLPQSYVAETVPAAAVNVTVSVTGQVVTVSTDTVAVIAETVPAIVANEAITLATRMNTTVNKPVGTIDDDVMIATVTSRGSPLATDVTPPAGWTQIGAMQTVTDGSTEARYWMYWKRAASEGASYTFTHASAEVSATITSFRGCVTTGDPIDGFTQNQANSGMTATALALETTTNASEILYLGMNYNGTGTLTPPTGM